MPENPDAELTLPSVVATLPGTSREQDLVLTVIFHPHLARVGETTVCPRTTDDAPWIIGRLSPDFSRGDGQSRGSLGEQHVSRQALALVRKGQTVTIQRLPGASRCRLGGTELEGAVELQQEQLCSGVPLLLGHSVLLLLRLAPPGDAAAVDYPVTGLLRGSSACMVRLKEQIAQAAASDVDVLIRGETGTGKELVATAIHRASRRAEASLVSVNMAAIPSALAPAALFGSTRGAFTGANQANDGYFAQAEGGSLFLDEIGDTPPDIQPQLLRALQEREIQAVGGPIRRANVRVISATDAALDGQDCDFKSALRHRLGACEIRVPPLREHPEDIGELLVHFLLAACEEAAVGGLLPTAESAAPLIAVWAELFHSFLCYRWPGNVRELANFSRQVVLASGKRLTVPDTVIAALGVVDEQQGVTRREPVEPPRRRIRDIDDAEFDKAMQTNRYEAAGAARQLQVSRQSVYRRMEESPRYRLAGQVPQDELERALAAQNDDTAAAARQLQVSLSGLRARLRGSGKAR